MALGIAINGRWTTITSDDHQKSVPKWEGNYNSPHRSDVIKGYITLWSSSVIPCAGVLFVCDCCFVLGKMQCIIPLCRVLRSKATTSNLWRYVYIYQFCFFPRVLESELSRLKYRDPVKSCELPEEDIVFDETGKEMELGELPFNIVMLNVVNLVLFIRKKLSILLIWQKICQIACYTGWIKNIKNISSSRVISSEYSEFYCISFGYLHPEIQSFE